MLKKICCWLKKWIIVMGVLFATSFYLLHIILNIFELEFRQLVTYSTIFISLVLFIVGSFQLIFKIRNRAAKIISTTLLTIILLVSSPYIVFFVGFSYLPEHVVIKNDMKLVAYVDGFMHTNVKYYDYKNLLVRSTRLRLYEDYGSGGFDPIKNAQGITYEVKSYTWYDDEGNPLD